MGKKQTTEAPKVKKGSGDTKTHHQTGWHKKAKNPTNNYRMDSHKAFCERCMAANLGICPVTRKAKKAAGCHL